MDTASSTKPSGIPRPQSKLPVLRPTSTRTSLGSGAITQSQGAVQTPTDIVPPKSAKSAVVSGTPKVQKRIPSAPISSRPAQPAVKTSTVANAKPGTARPNLSNGPKHNAKPSIGSRLIARPTSAQTKRLSNISKASTLVDDDEKDDQLSSLDSFRSASRSGSRLGSYDDVQPETLEFVEPSSVNVPVQQTKSSRPSLTERTIETLQKVPTTPEIRRRSSFFNPESPMGPPPRPRSSLSRHGSHGSRPGTSDGTFARPSGRVSPPKKGPASARPATRTSSVKSSIGSISGTRRSISGGLTSRLQEAKTPTASKIASPIKAGTSSLPNGNAKVATGRTTIASSRPAKPRPVLGDAFAPTKRKEAETTTAPAAPVDGKRVVSNSSAALRQQIAAAKAAARKEKESTIKHDSPMDSSTVNDAAYDLDLSADPFNQAPKDDKHILRNRINNARTDGKLNIAAMGLKEIPEEVRKMYDSASMEESNVNWAEVVDLTRFIAADNELETIDDSVFPDRSAEEIAADDQSEGNQFGGLEMLDLHGNSLQTLPMGLRRLERLTTLNLAHNKLDNAAFDVIAQIPQLKELRLGNNNLNGSLPSSLCDLRSLEVLDVQANRLLGLPEALRELVSLRVLNVSGNQLTSLPMEALEQLPLTELDASSNALIASLFPLGGSNGHPTLQILNVANNSLAALTFSEKLDVPKLRTLNLTNNHLTVLPSVEGWTELTTLHVGDNKVIEFPPGFTTLQKLRNVNFTSNDIRLVDTEICKMERLESLILASNPLREKKFLTMNAADIKRELRARLAPEQSDSVTDEDIPGSPVTVIGADSHTSLWSLRANGLLDLSSKNLSDELNDTLGSFLNSNEVKTMQLQNNRLTCIPPAMWMGQDLRVLDLSGNSMSSDYLYDELVLPNLQELSLSQCRLTSLEPLTSQLQAPKLHTLNVSANRLSGPLPALRETYLSLTTLFASDNKFRSISVTALRGLQTVNLKSNDIEALPAEIGLLWDEGLRNFEVGSNAFRVPNYRVLEKGTMATMRWLRDRIPAQSQDEESARQGAVEGYVSELE
ncbi:Leucine-rich repeat-containing protein 40 [Pseudocercospora fuligena]|uniref:Leucine-rich repeat-containing protein 40 n=1 Tax=Pseudocercospora fuligena TaxID=685502 RepID=A0A8H6RA96_9PEZI|nr:Leucine-rich repeat-containing protein 40 [Pseudocercospora fuligena]